MASTVEPATERRSVARVHGSRTITAGAGLLLVAVLPFTWRGILHVSETLAGNL